MATGGIDSTLLMYEMSSQDPIVISVNYGQSVWKHQKELIHYHMQRCRYSHPLVEINIRFEQWQKTPGLFTEGWIPPTKEDLKDLTQIPHNSYLIEGRNSIMLCYALAYCASHTIDELYMGYKYEMEEWENIRSTYSIANDTSPHFVDTMNILALSGFSRVVRIRAPFYERRWDKQRIIEECIRRGIDLDKTYSCYFWPGPCGKCDNCLQIKRALERIKEKSKQRK